MTLIVRGRKGEEVVMTVRLQTASAVAKARELASIGWRVTIECPNGIRKYLDDFGLLCDPGSQIIDGSRDETNL